jgi:hypothetical protein
MNTGQLRLQVVALGGLVFIGGEVKPSVPFRVYGKLKILAGMKRDLSYAKSAISRQVSPASLQGVSAGYCQRVLVDELGMTKTQWENKRSDMVAMYGTPLWYHLVTVTVRLRVGER